VSLHYKFLAKLKPLSDVFFSVTFILISLTSRIFPSQIRRSEWEIYDWLSLTSWEKWGTKPFRRVLK